MVRFGSLMLVAMTCIAFVSCQKISSRQDLEKIQELEKKADTNREAASRGAAQLDSKLLEELGTAYMQWADHYPDAPETPEFLFRAGEVYSNELQNFKLAIDAFERDYKQYPKHETAANALFFIGYLYNNSLHDLPKAEQYYKEFLAAYPEHNMAEHAQFELKTLGMSPDEVFANLLLQDSTAQNLDSATQTP